ncbi:MAG: DUF1810 domain-containing protein [Muribaculaceae bacterium]
MDTLETNDRFNLDRFLSAQANSYDQALKEINDGYKYTHWIWFIFPQIKQLGHSTNAIFYGISGIDEAKAYLEHPILGARLREISKALLKHQGTPPRYILGETDAVKVRSCMTLFNAISPDDIFQEVLDAFYEGKSDPKTKFYLA